MNRTLSLRRAAMLAAIACISQLTAPLASADSTGGAGKGISNTATGIRAFVGGGQFNTASGEGATISGGRLGTNSGRYGTIGGGIHNKASAEWAATISGGYGNAVTGSFASIGGGQFNEASGSGATVAGGSENMAGGNGATVGGGEQNSNRGVYGFIGGGFSNKVTASYAAVPGGARGKAMHNGSFVWSGVATVDTVSTNANSFTVRAPGGVRFITSATATSFVSERPVLGVILLPGTTAWTALSDRESKTDFKPIKPREVLSKLAAMPVTSWKYKHDPSRRYIGPTSQDFMEAFHLGNYDKGINALDADGVTFAAIKGLVEELKERDSRIEKLETELQAIREQLSGFPPAP